MFIFLMLLTFSQSAFGAENLLRCGEDADLFESIKISRENKVISLNYTRVGMEKPIVLYADPEISSEQLIKSSKAVSLVFALDANQHGSVKVPGALLSLKEPNPNGSINALLSLDGSVYSLFCNRN